MTHSEPLSETEQLLLMAAAYHGLGPRTDLGYANTATVVLQVLQWAGLFDDEVRAAWRADRSHPAIDRVYGVLVRMTRQTSGEPYDPGRSPERPGEVLFEGSGNWGRPGDPDYPPFRPHYNSSRLTARGEEIALALLENEPKYRETASRRAAAREDEEAATDYAQLAGEISATGGLPELEMLLARAGVRAAYRESSHYEGGTYLRPWVGADIRIECVGAGDFLIRGDAERADELLKAGGRLSDALGETETRHRLEVYDEDGRLAHYFHHRWPRSDRA